MADIADLAEEQIERNLKDSLSKAGMYRGLIHAGRCHFCDEPISSGLFCHPVDKSGDGCARDYEREKKIQRIAGSY